MSNFLLEVDSKEIASAFGNLQKDVEAAVNKAVGALAASTHAKAMEMANDKLKTTAGTFKEALSFEKLSPTIWVVSLDMKKAGWIEEGRKAGFMEELLRGKSSKISKNGKRYAIIPFQHNKNPSEQTPKAQELMGQIKTFLKKEGIRSRKLEFNADGSPKMGLLHRFDVGSELPSAKAQYAALSGLAIYQRKDAKSGKVKKQIMTFRVITEDHKADGRWVHPGRQGAFIIDDVYKWASDTWESQILPGITASFSNYGNDTNG